jgi:hypothetical protein
METLKKHTGARGLSGEHKMRRHTRMSKNIDKKSKIKQDIDTDRARQRAARGTESHECTHTHTHTHTHTLKTDSHSHITTSRPSKEQCTF